MNHGPPFHTANQVLGDFRDQFIADMDASTVVWELLYKDIIPRGVQERISRTDEPKQQNEILHDCLQRTCTKGALMEVCNIIVTVKGHPKMRQLGEAMKWRLHTGECVVCLCMEWRSLSPLTPLSPPHSTLSPSPLSLPHPTRSPHSTQPPSLQLSPSLHSVLCPLYRHS